MNLLTCNPPYISSGKVSKMDREISAHEPREAFDGGVFGVAILNRFLKEAPRFLVSGGAVCFEVGLGQGPGILGKLEKQGVYTDLQTGEDDEGNIRAISAVRV